MTTVQRHIKVQIGATEQPQSVRADGNLATRVKNLSKHGWSPADTDKLVRSPQLNDKSPIPGTTDEYANKSEGAVLRPMMAKARDMRKKVVIDGKEFKFTNSASRDYFVSQMGKWFAENAK